MSKLKIMLSELQKEFEHLEKRADADDELQEYKSALSAIVRQLRYELRGTQDAIKYAEKDGYLPISLIRWEERRDVLLDLIQEIRYYEITANEFKKQEKEEQENEQRTD